MVCVGGDGGDGGGEGVGNTLYATTGAGTLFGAVTLFGVVTLFGAVTLFGVVTLFDAVNLHACTENDLADGIVVLRACVCLATSVWFAMEMTP